MSLPTPNQTRPTVQTEGHEDLAARVAAFREQYVGKLAAPHGWWAIASLDWLEHGESLLGSGPGSRLPLPAGAPERAALLTLEDEQVVVAPLADGLELDGEALVEPRATSGVASLSVPAGEATLLAKLIRRGDLFGVRVYDPRLSAARDRDASVAWFEPDPAWVVVADFVPPLPGETVPIVNALGQVVDAAVAGRAMFERDGQRHSLVATAAGTPGKLFFNFRDATNLHETYGGGRFLNVDGPVDGRIVLDFNLCHHPPCAHTAYATCPVPPEENRLPFAVRAGERYPDVADTLDRGAAPT